MTSIAGKTVFITGGSSGMGLAAAQELAGRGSHVIIFDLNPNDAATGAIEASRRMPDQRVGFFRLNVADRDLVIEAFGLAMEQFGAPDIVINMAGIGAASEFETTTHEVFDRIIQINLYGSRNVVEAALTSMLARGSGKIVLVGSMGGIIPVFGYTAYGASKFAVVGFAQCLRYEMKPRGVGVACFCPGEVETPGLAAERKVLPPASAALKKIGGSMPVERAVRGLIEGIERDQFMIIPGFRTRLTYVTYRLTPVSLWNFITDGIVSRAIADRNGRGVSRAL